MAMKSEGYIKLFRSLSNWEWINDPNMVCVWVHLLLLANWEDVKWKGITIPRGSFITSYKQLAEETGLTEKQVRRCIEGMQRTGEVAKKRANKYSIITICNYESYQGEETPQGQTKRQTKGRQQGSQRADKGQTTIHSTNILTSRFKEEQEEERNNSLTGVKKENDDTVDSFFHTHTFS